MKYLWLRVLAYVLCLILTVVASAFWYKDDPRPYVEAVANQLIQAMEAAGGLTDDPLWRGNPSAQDEWSSKHIRELRLADASKPDMLEFEVRREGLAKKYPDKVDAIKPDIVVPHLAETWQWNAKGREWDVWERSRQGPLEYAAWFAGVIVGHVLYAPTEARAVLVTQLILVGGLGLVIFLIPQMRPARLERPRGSTTWQGDRRLPMNPYGRDTLSTSPPPDLRRLVRPVLWLLPPGKGWRRLAALAFVPVLIWPIITFVNFKSYLTNAADYNFQFCMNPPPTATTWDDVAGKRVQFVSPGLEECNRERVTQHYWHRRSVRKEQAEETGIAFLKALGLWLAGCLTVRFVLMLGGWIAAGFREDAR